MVVVLALVAALVSGAADYLGGRASVRHDALHVGFVSQLTNLIVLPAFACGVLGLGLYSGAYVSEIVRGAIQSIDRGQVLAAQSLGMTERQVMRHVVLPQALVRMIPPLGNEFIALIKNSALVSLLTIHDLMHEGQKIIAVSYRSLEVYLAVAAVYLVLTGSTAWVLKRIEHRLNASRRLG